MGAVAALPATAFSAGTFVSSFNSTEEFVLRVVQIAVSSWEVNEIFVLIVYLRAATFRTWICILGDLSAFLSFASTHRHRVVCFVSADSAQVKVTSFLSWHYYCGSCRGSVVEPESSRLKECDPAHSWEGRRIVSPLAAVYRLQK